mgnify:CR=1 FL=1
MRHLKTLTKRPAEAQDIPQIINIVSLIQGVLTALLAFTTEKEQRLG